MCREMGEICVLRSVSGGVTYSVAPAAQQVVGHGVLRLQRDGFIQMILGGEGTQTQRHRAEDLHC